jgi:phosphoribosylformylglycinamidine synthase I
MLIIPGGFSYGDDLGAGKLWALDLEHYLGDNLARFIEQGRPVLGICNGFQTLVKAGFLPGAAWSPEDKRPVTLTFNEVGRFECHWVYLRPNPQSTCLFTEDFSELIYCPVAHGEGRLTAKDEITLQKLWADGLVPLVYSVGGFQDDTLAPYPLNPNGSSLGIAALCNPAGNVMGLMPHPENYIFSWQHPNWHRGESGMSGLKLFQNAVKYAKS